MLTTYVDTSRREDLLGIVADLSPDDTPLATMLKTSTAKDTVHQWLEDYITPQTALPTFSAEGAGATYTALTQPSRILNLTAILTQSFRVSGTERATNPGGGQDPLDYQAGKARQNVHRHRLQPCDLRPFARTRRRRRHHRRRELW